VDGNKVKIQYWRSKNDLPHNGKLSAEEEKRRMKLYQQGLNDREIADRVGITKAAVWEWRKSNGKDTEFTAYL